MTLLLMFGVPPHIVQSIVGHADVHVTMTMTINAHPSLEDQRERHSTVRRICSPDSRVAD